MAIPLFDIHTGLVSAVATPARLGVTDHAIPLNLWSSEPQVVEVTERVPDTAGSGKGPAA